MLWFQLGMLIVIITVSLVIAGSFVMVFSVQTLWSSTLWFLTGSAWLFVLYLILELHKYTR